MMPGALTTGFSELSTYYLHARNGWTFFVDDIQLELVTWQGECAWLWRPNFFAGEVTAELLDENGTRICVYRLDVSPDAKKLGRDAFGSMIDEILDFDPSLLFGTEDAQVAIGSDGAMTSPHLQYSRLRRYGDQFLGGLRQIVKRPVTKLVRERALLSAHTVKRIDSTAIRRGFNSSGGRALLHPEVVEKPPLNSVRLDVAIAREDLDNAANQAIGLILADVVRRCKKVSAAFIAIAEAERDSETRSPIAPRLKRRLQHLRALQGNLEKLNAQRPFCGLTARRLSAAGLNAISAHPEYSRAYRFGRLALRPGVIGEISEESLWISPTWEIYERWCYVMVVQQLKSLWPNLEWIRRPSPKNDRILWRGVRGDLSLDVWLQVLCPSVDKKPFCGFQSLSRQRIPDIVITLNSPAGHRFIILDAKYRESRHGVLKGMESAHLYHDCLRWNGVKPHASLLLIPRGGAVSALQDPAFHASHGVGVVALGSHEDAVDVGRRLMALLLGQ